ncbi:solute carrier family 25 member 38 [Thamnidium elegans]|nr:solute carrier family 25 member 38 [Thamnidium elegans]
MTKNDKKNPALHLVGGALSGMTACVMLQPLDLIKTRLQQQRQDHLAFLKEAKSKGLLVSPQKSNIYSTVKDIVSNNGYSGLWRGTVPTIMRNVPGSALYFFALSEVRMILANTRSTWQPLLNKAGIDGKTTAEHQRWENLVSGSTARGAVGYIMMPITVVKVRYESNFYNYTSLNQAFKSIIKTDGIRGLFAGYGATFIRDAPFAGIYLFFYEGCKTWANEYSIRNQLPVANAVINMGSGVVAGMAATCTTQPFDMLKTRMQLKPMIYKNLIQSARKVYMEEGFVGFFDGISVRLIRKPLNSAISWTIYEEVVRWYDRKDQLMKDPL